MDLDLVQAALARAASPFHLGDGAYAHFDGYQIWLTTQTGDKVALDPSVFGALLGYRSRLKREFVELGALSPEKGVLG
jgi:hypothetical protein